MEDSEALGEAKTLEAQYETVVQLTNKSHPQEYGDQSFKKTDTVGIYIRLI